MKPEKLKGYIKKKFGTISRFSEVSGIERLQIQKAFMPFYADDLRYINFRRDLAAKAMKLKSTKKPSEVSEEQLKALRKAIDEHGGCYAVSQKIGFRVYPIYNGDCVRIKGRVEQLLNYFDL